MLGVNTFQPAIINPIVEIGFTVFVERKIMGRLHGEPFRHFAAIGGKTYLADTVCFGVLFLSFNEFPTNDLRHT